MPSHEPPVWPAVLATLSVFTMLCLISISLPLVHPLYFLYINEGSDLKRKFGMWGWCLYRLSGADWVLEECSAPSLAYSWEPEVTPNFMKANVCFPIAAAFTLLAFFVYMPACVNRTPRTDRIFSYIVLLAFMASAVAFSFSVAVWSMARDRAHSKLGHESNFGPVVWLSLASTLLLFVLSLHTGCGTCSGSRRGPYPPLPYRY